MWLQRLTESNTSGSSGFDNHGLVSLDSIFISVSEKKIKNKIITKKRNKESEKNCIA